MSAFTDWLDVWYGIIPIIIALILLGVASTQDWDTLWLFSALVAFVVGAVALAHPSTFSELIGDTTTWLYIMVIFGVAIVIAAMIPSRSNITRGWRIGIATIGLLVILSAVIALWSDLQLNATTG